MKVRVTFDVPENIRRAIRERAGKEGVATREEVARDARAIVFAVWQDYAYELEHGKNPESRP